MASGAQSQRRTDSPQAGSSRQKSLRLLAKWRGLREVHARADRVALTLRDGTPRARRLYRYVLRECGEVPAVAEMDLDSWSRASRLALRNLIRPVRNVLLRRILMIFGGALVICSAILLLALALPSGRAWLFPPNLGQSAQWRATSAMSGNSKAGIGTSSDGPLFFHTMQESNPYIDLDFGKMVNVRRVVIENRSDCCAERALPLNVEIMEPEGPRLLCQRRAPFQSWTCNTGGVRTKTLRIRRPGSTMLHLRRIEVFE